MKLPHGRLIIGLEIEFTGFDPLGQGGTFLKYWWLMMMTTAAGHVPGYRTRFLPLAHEVSDLPHTDAGMPNAQRSSGRSKPLCLFTFIDKFYVCLVCVLYAAVVFPLSGMLVM